MVEPITDNDEQVIVTFLWREIEEIENVVVVSYIGGLYFAENRMTRLLDTNLWYKTYQIPSNLRLTYRLSVNDSLIPMKEVTDWIERMAHWQADPLNKNCFTYPVDEEIPDDKEVVLSVLELPKTPVQTWILRCADVPKGQIKKYRIQSDILENERRCWVYTPPNYTVEDEPYGFMLLFDGWAYTELVPTPHDFG